MTERPEPTRYGEAIWLEPFPDVLLDGIADQAPSPEARYETKEAIELGFIVGLQHLPPQQARGARAPRRARCHSEEVAAMLETAAPAVNSLLRRARAAFESRLPAGRRDRAPLPNSKHERDTVGRFADAIQTGDVEGVVALLTDDAWLTMPPEPYEYQGPAAIGAFLSDRMIRRGAPLLVPTRANTQPAFRRLLPNPRDRDRPTVRHARPNPGRPTDRCDHLVRRQQRVRALRAAAGPAIAKGIAPKARPPFGRRATRRRCRSTPFVKRSFGPGRTGLVRSGRSERSTTKVPGSISNLVRTSRNWRRRGSGGIQPVRKGAWRVDVEVARNPVTGQGRRVARLVRGTRADTEIALARLKVADH